MIHRIRTIDAHAAGEPLRLIVDGFPNAQGKTMLAKREWVRQRHDWLRRALMFEPRGHADMYGAVLTEAVVPGSHAGVLFMHNEGYSTMCGHGVIAVVTIAIERGLMHVPGDPPEIVLDSPAGRIRAQARLSGQGPEAGDSGAPARDDPGPRAPAPGPRVESVSFVNVPSFVFEAGVPVRVGPREVRADVAFGGAFYAIVDSEAVGLPIDAAHLRELRHVGMEIKRGVEAAIDVAHPHEPGLKGIYGTIFTGPPTRPEADLRNVTVFADAEIDRSPCGTGTSAVMAVLDAMGLLAADRDFVHESLIGTLFRGRLAGRAIVAGLDAIVPEIEGSAWITGEHTFLIDEGDPLKEGFKL